MRRIIASAGCGWSGNLSAADNSHGLRYNEGDRKRDATIAAVWDKPQAKDARAALATDGLTKADQSTTAPYEHGLERLDVSKAAPNAGAFPLDSSVTTPYGEQLTPMGLSSGLPFWPTLPTKDVSVDMRFESVQRFAVKPVRKVYEYYLPSFNLAYRGEIKLSFNFADPAKNEPRTKLSPVGISSTLAWRHTRKLDRYVRLRYGETGRFIISSRYKTVFLVPPPDPVDPVDPSDPAPEVKKVYRIMNVVNLIALPDLTPVFFSEATLQRDLDSYAWTLTATLQHADAVDKVSPKGGAIKELRLTINGDTWEFFVTRIRESKVFGKQVWTITANSRTKLLAEPYSPVSSGAETTPSTAAQIASNALFGSGFTLNWQTVDWNIPAGVYSYSSQSPLSIVLQLAGAVGAVIKPDPATAALTVAPRYAQSAWGWQTATPDRTIPRALFKETEEEYQPRSKVNAVYVAGQEHGALVKVKQLGTAGDKLLPDVIDNLLTDQTANTERGRIELSNAGHKEIFTGNVFYDSQTGFVDIGELVRIQASDGSYWQGVVISNSIAISKMGSYVTQQLSIMRHYD